MAKNEEEIELFYQDNAPSYKPMAKLHELHFELFLPTPYSPDLAHSDYWMFADLRRRLQGIFCSIKVFDISRKERVVGPLLITLNELFYRHKYGSLRELPETVRDWLPVSLDLLVGSSLPD